jgi:hypothetical protein
MVTITKEIKEDILHVCKWYRGMDLRRCIKVGSFLNKVHIEDEEPRHKEVSHDGLCFFVSEVAVLSKAEVIGFYFDKLGYAQEVRYHSIYGDIIMRILKEKKI